MAHATTPTGAMSKGAVRAVWVNRHANFLEVYFSINRINTVSFTAGIMT